MPAIDWRGKAIPRYAPPVPVRLDYATGLPVCNECEGSLEGRSARTRFCDHACRSRYHSKRAHERSKVTA